LIRLNTNDTYGLIAALDDMALKKGYGKIFAIIPATEWNAFKSADYIKEALVPGLFAGTLLSHMDKKACELGIKTAYTIARAASPGMNAVFQNSGYNYAGLLKNNSQICGSIQSMTVWYKHL
jgi:hypothetical protein